MKSLAEIRPAPHSARTSPGAGDPRAEIAAQILAKVFGATRSGARFRLWNGREIEVGRPDGSFTIVVRDAGALRTALAAGDTGAIAEAFISNRIDVEGDLFSAMRLANELDEVRLGWRDKLRLWRQLRRLRE